jgi:hypothetical protein
MIKVYNPIYCYALIYILLVSRYRNRGKIKNVTTLDNDDIDISMSHILLFPKIYNLAVCQLLRQISKNRYTATLLLIYL